VIETEMEDTVADHGKKTHEKDSTKATVTKRILANCVDIRSSRTLFGLSCGGFLEYPSFIPSSPRGKRYFQQGSMPSPHLCLQFDLHYSHRTQTAFPLFIMVLRKPPLDALVFVFWLRIARELGRSFSRLGLLALGEHALALISEVKSEVM